jgi:hypothetical protein
MKFKRLKKKNKAFTAITLSLGLLFTLLQTQQAFADQCLSQFPDSNWMKGQPTEVSSLLNRDLILAKVVAQRTMDGKNLQLNSPQNGVTSPYAFVNDYLNNTYTEYIWKSGFVPITYAVTLTYQYEGVNCSTRTIRVQTGSVTYKPYFELGIADLAKIKESLYRLTQENGLKIEKMIEAISNFGQYLSSTETLPLKFSQITSYLNETNKLSAILDKEQFIVFLQSDDNCVVDYSPRKIDFEKSYIDKLSLAERNFYENSFFLSSNFSTLLKFNSNNRCKLRVSFLIQRSSAWIPPIAYPEFFLKGNEPVRVNGYLWLTNDLPASNTKTTITCIKGKLTKKVTAVKPKCPSGYKVKK